MSRPKVGRRGEKIPAAGRAVVAGLVVGDRPAATGEEAWLALQGTGLLAVRTRLLLGEGLRLEFQEGAQGALQQSLGGGLGGLLEGEQIDVERRAVVAEGAPGDDFAPLGGEIM